MYTQSKTISLVASSLLAGTLLLTGCGGGGGGGSANNNGGGGGTSTITLSGTAVDELIVNGVVKAHKNSASGEVLASGRTNDHGIYTLTVPEYEGVVVVKVECDASSKLFFPETNETKDCPTDLQLYSAAPVKGEGELKISVTPATQAFFALATQGNYDATLTPEAVDQARNRIAAVLGGIDPVTTDPVEDPTYKAVVKAFQDAAEETNQSTLEIIEAFAEDASDGELGDDSAITRTVAENMAENGVTSPFVEAIENNETYTPPENAASLDDISQAKAFFDSLRTQGESLFDKDGFFDRESQAIEAAIDNTTLNADLAAKALDNLLIALTEAIQNEVQTYTETIVDFGDSNRTVTVTKSDATTWNYEFKDNDTAFASGTITVPDIDYNDDNIVETFTSLAASIDGTIPATKLYESERRVQTFKGDVKLTRTEDGAKAEIDNIELSTADGTKLGISAIEATFGYDYDENDTEDPFTPNYAKLDTITLNGALDSSYSATGTLNVTYAINSSLANLGGIQESSETTIGGHLDCASTTYNGTVTYSLDGESHSFTVNDGYFRFTLEGDYDYDEIDAFFANNADSMQYSETCLEPTYHINFVDNDYDELVGNSGYLPSKITFNGDLKHLGGSGIVSEITGNIAVELLNATTMRFTDLGDTEDKPNVKVYIHGTLKRAGLDDTVLNITYRNAVSGDNKRITGQTVNVSYVYGVTSVTIDATLDSDGKNGTVDIASGTGLAITLKIAEGDIDYDNTSPLTKDGRVVGHLDDETGIPRIKYIDGSFESLP
jgi:hypothetical protein